MKLKSIIFVWGIILAFFAFSCSQNSGFTIEGTIKDGEGKMLYLENIGTNFGKVVDSVRIDKKHAFRFKGENQTGSPDFYRIRLKNQFINIAIDSTETVRIVSDTLSFAKNYTVEGSVDNERIKELTLLQVQTNADYNKLWKQYEANEISQENLREQLGVVLGNYKDQAKECILANPTFASAYFALLQQIDGLLIFDPYNSTDSKLFGVVANVWNNAYPEAVRTEHLVNLFKTSLLEIRKQNQTFTPQELSVMDAFDFTLRSVNNTSYTLSEVAQGKVLLLDFTSYALNNSPHHTLQLAEVYEKFSNKGFEIMQVSLDPDQHFWKNAAINLPWICVNDPRSVDSDLVKRFNLKDLPVGFLFDKKGEIVTRIEDYAKLEKELRLLMK
ncbi:DUF4369 domain-containing protein [Bacteroidales bacterium OttesenSCG-928-A17]|nr:DUF4369 domain-containing protein [Bacteroidales bacterium OttesenSCG-928-A17]